MQVEWQRRRCKGLDGTDLIGKRNESIGQNARESERPAWQERDRGAMLQSIAAEIAIPAAGEAAQCCVGELPNEPLPHTGMEKFRCCFASDAVGGGNCACATTRSAASSRPVLPLDFTTWTSATFLCRY